MQQWTVLIDWKDSDVEDTDEFQVRAKTSAQAVLKILPEWFRSVLLKWPGCTVEKISVFASKRIRRQA